MEEAAHVNLLLSNESRGYAGHRRPYILLDYQSLYGDKKEDEPGLSSCDLLGSDAGTVPPDDPLH